MTRAGSGGGPVEGRHGAPSTGRHADAEPAPERGRGRHAAPDADGADGRAALERALREPPPGGRRRTRPAPVPVVTERDEPPGRWNGFGPGALVLPARVNGRHSSAEEAAPAPPALNGWHAAGSEPLAPLNGWDEPEPRAANGHRSRADHADRWREPPADRPATEPEPPAALNGWHAGPPGRAGDLPAAVDDWQVESPTGWHPAEPEPERPTAWRPAEPEPAPPAAWHPAEPEPAPPAAWHPAEPEPAPPAANGHQSRADLADRWREPPADRPATEPEPPAARNGWHAGPPGRAGDLPAPVDDWQVESPTGWHPAEPEPAPPAGWHPAEPEPAPPAGWRPAEPGPAPPAVNGHPSPAALADDWQVDRPIPLPARPERIGDLPAPVEDRPADRRALRPPPPPQPQPQPLTGVPLEARRATPSAPAAYRGPPLRVDGPLPPPSAGRRAPDAQRPLNGPGPVAHPIGERVVHVFDGDSTQLLHRYVPARETLDREDRQPAPTRPPTLRKHPPRAVVRRRRARRRLLEWPFLIVFALLSAYLIRAYVVQTFYIPSGSMHETLLEGDRVLVNKVSYHLHDVDRGDVVVFRRPPDFPAEDEDLIKRVVALPGETVEARGRQIYVNGKPLTEPYVEPLCQGTQDFAAVTVPAGDLWVMGDNRCNSSDSRVFGPISEDLLVGRAFVLAWPFARLSWL